MDERYGFTFPLEGLSLADHRAVLRDAEAMGYTDAWSTEVSGLDAFVPIAAAASCTEALRFGTAIANVFTRGAALLAMSVAALSEAAPRRFVLGLGSSTPVMVSNWNGIPYRQPITRIRESVRFVRSALAGDKVENEALGVSGFRMARTLAATPPIMVAALRPRMLATAGEVADGVILGWLAPSDVPKAIAEVAAAAKAAGRDPATLEVVCSVPVFPLDEADEARTLARRLATAYLTTPAYGPYQQWLGRGDALAPVQQAWDAGDRKAALAAMPDEIVDELLLLGDVDHCTARIQAYRDNGVTVPIIEPTPTAGPLNERAAQSLELLKQFART